LETAQNTTTVVSYWMGPSSPVLVTCRIYCLRYYCMLYFWWVLCDTDCFFFYI